MPLILVVEKEQRYVERVTEALSPEGWSVEGVDNRAAAEQAFSQKRADLVVLSSEIEGTKAMLAAFSKPAGGPGTVLLIPESAGDEIGELEADEVVQKPFTAKAIRQAVRRCLSDETTKGGGTDAEAHKKGVGGRSGSNGRSPQVVSAGVPAGAARVASKPAKKSGAALLTSEDIFGDVVSELESAIGLGSVTAVAEVEIPEAETGTVEPPPDRQAEVAASAAPEPPRAASVEEAPEIVAETEAPEKPVDEGESRAKRPAVAEQTAAERPAAPRPDPTKALEERIRQAAQEGARMARGAPRQYSPEETESADDLLRNALLGIRSSGPPAARPQRASKEEVDALLSTVVGRRRPAEKPMVKPADKPAEDGSPVEVGDSEDAGASTGTGSPVPSATTKEEASDDKTPREDRPAPETGSIRAAAAFSAGVAEIAAPEAPGHDEKDEDRERGEGSESGIGYSPVLEVYGQSEERGQGIRMKLIWAIIIIVFLALLAFIFAGRAAASERDSASVDALVAPRAIEDGRAPELTMSQGFRSGTVPAPVTTENRPGDCRTAIGDVEVTNGFVR